MSEQKPRLPVLATSIGRPTAVVLKKRPACAKPCDLVYLPQEAIDPVPSASQLSRLHLAIDTDVFPLFPRERGTGSSVSPPPSVLTPPSQDDPALSHLGQQSPRHRSCISDRRSEAVA